jgi:predicted ribosome quality control (RQC) complex YloA/Tae2 family protein
MYFDALTTAAVADQMRQCLLGGRVQRIVQIDTLSLGLEIFAEGVRHQVLASADPQHPRLYMVAYKVRRGVEAPTSFLLLARKHIQGARLIGIDQPPFERLLSLRFSGSEGKITLLAELIERRANLILLQANRVLDAVQRVTPDINRFRTVLPGKPYSPPPPQPKLDPTDVTELSLRQILSETDPERPVWRVLVGGIAGTSPLFAREVVFRATGATETRVRACERLTLLLDAYLDALVPYWEHSWQPGVSIDPDGRVTAFAPYPLTHLGRPEPTESISVALGRFYHPLLGSSPYQAAKAPLREAILSARQRIERRRSALTRQMLDPSAVDALRIKGELILAYSSIIEPGQTELWAQYDPEGPPLNVPFDPTLTPVANAQLFFREYEKAKRAAADIPKLLKATELEIDYLDQLATDLELAASWPEIDEVREALSAAGHLKEPPPARPRGAVSKPLRVVSEDGIVILVGRSSRQNEEVTFRQAGPEDLWLHARGVTGGHIIIKNAGKPVPDRTLQEAARLAAGYSAARRERDVPVDIVKRRRVRRLRGTKSRPGLVTYDGEETVRVRPKRIGEDPADES